ncbi:unnamed protein product [Chilo suppressalis]|uniref:LITAF domain-containing protein n=1 Tax=Chilo suppressalis TaxID=168631 RepID=A0ABN8BC57_CHISP|nr:unnamed protein product [Chilo suppressalis]
MCDCAEEQERRLQAEREREAEETAAAQENAAAQERAVDQERAAQAASAGQRRQPRRRAADVLRSAANGPRRSVEAPRNSEDARRSSADAPRNSAPRSMVYKRAPKVTKQGATSVPSTGGPVAMRHSADTSRPSLTVRRPSTANQPSIPGWGSVVGATLLMALLGFLAKTGSDPKGWARPLHCCLCHIGESIASYCNVVRATSYEDDGWMEDDECELKEDEYGVILDDDDDEEEEEVEEEEEDEEECDARNNGPNKVSHLSH